MSVVKAASLLARGGALRELWEAPTANTLRRTFCEYYECVEHYWTNVQ